MSVSEVFDHVTLITRPPDAGITAREALDSALAAASIDKQVAIIITCNARQWLQYSTDPVNDNNSLSPAPSPMRLLKLSNLYDFQLLNETELTEKQLQAILTTAKYMEVV